MALRMTMLSPAMWLSGMQQSQRSAGSTPMLKAPPIALQRKLP